jgi:hypothetical protein
MTIQVHEAAIRVVIFGGRNAQQRRDLSVLAGHL